MPYKNTSELPDRVKNNLPEHAQEMYKEAFNSAYAEYKNSKDRQDHSSHEETAHKVAWSAVKKKYEKGDGDKWHQKGD